MRWVLLGTECLKDLILLVGYAFWRGTYGVSCDEFRDMTILSFVNIFIVGN